MKGLIALLAGLVTLCNSAVTYEVTVPTEKKSDEPIKTEVIEIQENTKIQGENFTDKLYNLMPEDKNYMYSPFSIKSALAMAANGAEGKTRTEILTVVGIDDLDKFNSDMSETIKKYSATDLLKFDISNSVWINTDNADYDFSDTYKNTVKDFYNGDVGTVTNKTALSVINGWVNEKTQGKIPSVINDSSFDAALINAIYFKAKWENMFSKANTKPDIFTDRNGKKTEIDFMNSTRKYWYGEKDGVKVLELEYMTRGTTGDSFKYSEENQVRLDNTSVSMFLLLSDSEIKAPEKLVDELCGNNLMEYRKVNLSFPKFKIEFSAEISPALKALGIKSAFSDANFKKMFDKDANTAISNVLHKTYIDVDEEGTEAAAITAIMMAGSAMPKPEEIIEFKADKPFTFLIRDNISGETFFIGEYAFAE